MNQWIEESYAVVFGSAGVQFGQFGFVGDISVGGVVVVVAGGHQQFPIALQSNPKTNEKKNQLIKKKSMKPSGKDRVEEGVNRK